MAFSNLLSCGLGGSPKLKNTGEPPVPRSLLNAIGVNPQGAAAMVRSRRGYNKVELPGNIQQINRYTHLRDALLLVASTRYRPFINANVKVPP